MSVNIKKDGQLKRLAGKIPGSFATYNPEHFELKGENKEMNLATAVLEQLGGGHDMVDTIEDVLSSSATENKVVNAFTISEYSNVYTEMIGTILTEGNNTIGKWFGKDETWDASLMLQDDRLIEHDNEQLSFEFDFWLGEAQGEKFKANTTPLHITGYQWDSTAGAITIRCAETAPNDITVVIKVTHIREKV